MEGQRRPLKLLAKLAIASIGLTACRSAADAGAGDAAPPAIDAATPLAASSSAAPNCAPRATTTHFGEGRCTRSEECVLTQEVVECDGCNEKTSYAAAKRDVEEKRQRCQEARCQLAGCPPPDTYSPAFFRAECRAGKCVRFRWHAGG